MAANVPPGSYSPLNAVQNARSPNPKFCYGYENCDTKGYYITTVKLSTGKVNKDDGDGLGGNKGLKNLVGYDTCASERNNTYLGQANMITVSSFSGPLSAIWGYDLAKVNPDELYANKLFDIDQPAVHGGKIPVYSMGPLLAATKSLFGTAEDRHYHFPVMAGAHLPCAEKQAKSIDPDTGKPTSGWVWAFLSLAIAVNRHVDASLFAEDTGFWPDKGRKPYEEEVEARLIHMAKHVAYSQILTGKNLIVSYKEIFMSWTKLYVDNDEFGMALTCAPYITLAQGVYPKGGTERLVEMSLSEWEEEILPPKHA